MEIKTELLERGTQETGCLLGFMSAELLNVTPPRRRRASFTLRRLLQLESQVTAGKLPFHSPLRCLRRRGWCCRLAGNEQSEDGDEFDF